MKKIGMREIFEIVWIAPVKVPAQGLAYIIRNAKVMIRTELGISDCCNKITRGELMRNVMSILSRLGKIGSRYTALGAQFDLFCPVEIYMMTFQKL